MEREEGEEEEEEEEEGWKEKNEKCTLQYNTYT